jgi:hypothetical protein
MNNSNNNNNNSVNNENSKKIILFYHNDSKACQKLFEIIPKNSNVNYVNIQNLQNIPSQITSIPTLIINNNEILSGKKVFNYFSKKDEMEYLSFNSKGNLFSFSSLDDDNIESNEMFSSLDAPDISQGVPEWKDDNSEKQTIDIDKLQAERDTMFKSVQRT